MSGLARFSTGRGLDISNDVGEIKGEVVLRHGEPPFRRDSIARFRRRNIQSSRTSRRRAIATLALGWGVFGDRLADCGESRYL